jgi:ankyrin repeat protein
VNAADNNGYTALHFAAESSECDDAPMIELLLASGADVHMCTVDGRTALDKAAFKGNLQCAKALIAAGADVNHTNSTGGSVLHTALIDSRAAVVQLLLEHGATAVVNSVIPLMSSDGVAWYGLTALMMCTTVDTMKLLLAAGADAHVSNNLGDTCLHAAVVRKHPVPAVCLLVKAGADLHAVNSNGKTAAQLAHDDGNTLIEQILNRPAQQER